MFGWLQHRNTGDHINSMNKLDTRHLRAIGHSNKAKELDVRLIDI